MSIVTGEQIVVTWPLQGVEWGENKLYWLDLYQEYKGRENKLYLIDLYQEYNAGRTNCTGLTFTSSIMPGKQIVLAWPLPGL